MTSTRYDDPKVDPMDATSATGQELAGAGTAAARLGDTARTVAGTVSDAAAEVGPRISGAAGSTAEAVREADRAIRSTSDQALGMVGALSLGSAIGLLVGGANRILVALSLVPAILVAKAIVERIDQTHERAAR